MRPGRDQPLREPARLVAVALDVLLGRVDLDEAHALAPDELDRVAIDHTGHDGFLRGAAGHECERDERDQADQHDDCEAP